MKQLLSYGCLHRRMIGLLAGFRVGRSQFASTPGARGRRSSGSIPVRIDGAAAVASLSRYRAPLAVNPKAPVGHPHPGFTYPGVGLRA